MVPPLLLLSACNGPDPAAEAHPRVVVLVMDGVRAEDSLGDRTSSATGLAPWEMLPQTWETLVPQGARAAAALNTGITITAPAHCELTSGLRQPLANYAVEEGVGIYRPELPSLIEARRAADAAIPQSDMVVTGNTVLIEPIAHSLWPDGGDTRGADFILVGRGDDAAVPAQTDEAVFDSVIEALETAQPTFLLANLHAVDRAGHYGESGDYPAQVQGLDAQLVRVWETMQRQPAYEEGWLVILSDHGRHRSADTEPPWRNHGDSCMGCRHIPLLILGPDVAAGETTDAPATLADVGVTVAALLGAELPMSTGRFLSEMFTATDGPSALGAVSVAAAGGAVAVSRRQDDPWHRSVVEVDGAVLSSPGALMAEAPSMAARGGERWLCFRELTVDLDADGAPWVPRCFWQPAGGAWAEIAAPAEEVSALWRPDLQATAPGELTAAWSNNTNGHAAASGGLGPIGVAVGTWRGAAWEQSLALRDLSFPLHPTLLPTDGPTLAAVAAADGETGRDRRRFYIASDHTGRFTEQAVLDLETLAPGAGGWRLERPSLHQDADGTRWLAGLGYSDDHTALVIAYSKDGGGWTDARAADVPGDILPHVAPRWHGDTVVFAATKDGSVSLCRLAPAASASGADCTDLDAPQLRDLAVDEDTAHAVVLRDGAWAVEPLPLPLPLPR